MCCSVFSSNFFHNQRRPSFLFLRKHLNVPAAIALLLLLLEISRTALIFCERADIKGQRFKTTNLSFNQKKTLPYFPVPLYFHLHRPNMTLESHAEYLAEKAEFGEFDIRTRNFGKYTSKAERIENKKPGYDHTRRLIDNWRHNDMNQRHSKA